MPTSQVRGFRATSAPARIYKLSTQTNLSRKNIYNCNGSSLEVCILSTTKKKKKKKIGVVSSDVTFYACNTLIHISKVMYHYEEFIDRRDS